MFCPNCGNNCGDAKFCSECGQDLRNLNLSNTETKVPESLKAEMPEPPIGRYENMDHNYVELDADSIIFGKKPLLMSATRRSIPYSSVKAVAYADGVKLRTGGYLSVQEEGNLSGPKNSVKDAVADETSITFSWKENAAFLKVYEFLRITQSGHPRITRQKSGLQFFRRQVGLLMQRGRAVDLHLLTLQQQMTWMMSP